MKKKIPNLKKDAEIAAFWDAHDFSEYIEDTMPADDVVFEKEKKDTVAIRLEREQIRDLKRLAHKLGLGYTSIVRSWIIEKLAQIHSVHHPKAR